LASSYDISTGTGRLNLASDESTYLAVQLVADATLDADVTVKLQQSSDDANYEDLTGASGTLVSGGDSILVETYDYVLNDCYLYVDVGSATTGTIDIFVSSKKKEDSSSTSIPSPLDVNVTNSPLDTEVTNTVDTNVTNSELDVNVTNTSLPVDVEIGDVTINPNTELIILLRNILKENKKTNKILNKIYQ
jgi:hypothetical protein